MKECKWYKYTEEVVPGMRHRLRYHSYILMIDCAIMIRLLMLDRFSKRWDWRILDMNRLLVGTLDDRKNVFP